MEAWESTVSNLGHCHRKLGRLDQAEACYLRARDLAPDNHAVHSSLALIHQMQVGEVISSSASPLAVQTATGFADDQFHFPSVKSVAFLSF